jgi:hypothetical protein
MMNESITCEEVLHLARHLHACMDEVVKSLQLLAAGADGAVLPAGSAGAFRTLADYIEWPPSMAATKLDAIAAGRVVEVRPSAAPTAEVRAVGTSTRCLPESTPRSGPIAPRCDGSGYEPAPPGRKQRTAYAVVARSTLNWCVSLHGSGVPCERRGECTTCDGDGGWWA